MDRCRTCRVPHRARAGTVAPSAPPVRGSPAGPSPAPGSCGTRWCTRPAADRGRPPGWPDRGSRRRRCAAREPRSLPRTPPHAPWRPSHISRSRSRSLDSSSAEPARVAPRRIGARGLRVVPELAKLLVATGQGLENPALQCQLSLDRVPVQPAPLCVGLPHATPSYRSMAGYADSTLSICSIEASSAAGPLRPAPRCQTGVRSPTRTSIAYQVRVALRDSAPGRPALPHAVGSATPAPWPPAEAGRRAHPDRRGRTGNR